MDQFYLVENDAQFFETCGCLWRILAPLYNSRLEPCRISKTSISSAETVILIVKSVGKGCLRRSWEMSSALIFWRTFRRSSLNLLVPAVTGMGLSANRWEAGSAAWAGRQLGVGGGSIHATLPSGIPVFAGKSRRWRYFDHFSQ